MNSDRPGPTTKLMNANLFSAAAALGLTALLAAGCYSPRGGMLPRTGGGQTYFSSETTQKSITIVDVRSGEEFFTIDIPPGKQLTFNFVEGRGDDPVMTPDLMRWQIFDVGTRIGRLRNALSVPNAASRRVDVEVRQAIEYAEAPPEERFRVDELADRPDWWTPRGGPLPARDPTGLYD